MGMMQSFMIYINILWKIPVPSIHMSTPSGKQLPRREDTVHQLWQHLYRSSPNCTEWRTLARKAHNHEDEDMCSECLALVNKAHHVPRPLIEYLQPILCHHSCIYYTHIFHSCIYYTHIIMY